MERHAFWSGAAPLPPPGPAERIEIEHVAAQGESDYTALGERLWSAYCHWDGRDVPCIGGPCPYCAAGTPRRKVVAYLAAFSWRTHSRCILHVTERAQGRCLEIARQHGGLRGLKLRFWRLRPKLEAPVCVLVASDDRDRNTPAAFEVEPFIRRLWRWQGHMVHPCDPTPRARPHHERPAPAAEEGGDNGEA